jgi:hypothetical protein
MLAKGFELRNGLHVNRTLGKDHGLARRGEFGIAALHHREAHAIGMQAGNTEEEKQ